MVTMRGRGRGQAMVEFALVAPILVLILLILLDFGRGLFYYSEMAAGAREAARQASLWGNSCCNASGGADTGGPLPGVVPQLTNLATFGYQLQPYTSGAPAAPVATYAGPTQKLANGTWGPGTVTLGSGANLNRAYIFVYELDPASGVATWDSGAPPVRSGGHKLVVVDLKMRWSPVVLAYAGLGTLTFDAQTVMREEF